MPSNKSEITIAASIYPPDIGGPATYTNTIAGKLADAGLNVGLITFHSGFKIKVRGEGMTITGVSRLWPKGLRHVIYFAKLMRLAKNSRAIFAQNATSVGLPAMIAAKMLKKKLAVKIVIDALVEVARTKSIKPTIGARFRHKLQRMVARRADLVIVPCAYLKGVVAGWGVAEKRIKVIYNGINIPSERLNRSDAREKLGLNGFVMLSVGRLVSGKGFSMLIKIMANLLKKSPLFRLVVVGDGYERDNLEKMIGNLNLKGKVIMAGRKRPDELDDYFSASDVFVLNSFSEGFAHVLIEAMAYGLPVVATDTGGNPEIVRDGYNGFLVKYNDEAALTETVRILSENDDLREKFSMNGMETAKLFSAKRMVEGTTKALTDI